MYHEVGTDHEVEDAWQVVRRRDFVQQVEHLRAHYEIVSLDEALMRQRRGYASGDTPLAVLTFDDGLRGNHRHLMPLLDELRVPVTVYVATGHIETQIGYWFDRVANALQPGFDGVIDLQAVGLGRFTVRGSAGAARWAQIQAVLSATKRLRVEQCIEVADLVESQVQAHRTAHGRSATGTPVLAPMTREMLAELGRHPLVTLGVHTHGHELLPLVDVDRARRSIESARELIREWTGHEARHFAYPSGRQDPQARALVESMGFTTAMGTDAGIWTAASDLMNIPRISVGRYDSLSAFKVNAVGGMARWRGHPFGRRPEPH